MDHSHRPRESDRYRVSCDWTDPPSDEEIVRGNAIIDSGVGMVSGEEIFEDCPLEQRLLEYVRELPVRSL